MTPLGPPKTGCQAAMGKVFTTEIKLRTQRTSETVDLTDELRQAMAKAGITDDKFSQCLSDKNLAQEIQQVAVRGYEVFGVEGTPTFFINGTMVIDGEASIENFSKVIDPLLK